MIYIDAREAIDFELLLAQCVEVERENLNPDRADLFWLGYGGRTLQWENKQAGELLGSLDSVEEQIGREMQGADYTGLTVRGIITPTVDGFCQTWRASAKNPNIIFTDRVYHQQYVGYAAWKARLWELGVPVIEVPNLQALVTTVVAVYNLSQKAEGEHKTFARLLPTHYFLTEADQIKRNVALSLMGLRPSWGGGEEVALALADRFPSVATLVNTLEAGADAEIAKVPLRHAKRSVGPAAVAKLRRSLGL